MFKYRYFIFFFFLMIISDSLFGMEINNAKNFKKQRHTKAYNYELKLKKIAKREKMIAKEKRLSLQGVEKRSFEEQPESRRNTIHGTFELIDQYSSEKMQDSEEFIKEKELEPNEEELAFIERLTRGLPEEIKQKLLRNYYNDLSDQPDSNNLDDLDLAEVQSAVPVDGNSNDVQAKKSFSIKKTFFDAAGIASLTAGLIARNTSVIGLASLLLLDD